MDKGYVQNTIFELLSRLGIGYEKLEHSPIITMKEGSEIAYKLGSTSCKNLFLCNKRQEYFMLMLPADKKLSAKNVARQIGSPHLSFASAEDMERLLHTYPGAVSVLSLIYDKEKRVQLLIDKGLMNVTYIGCHPCTNTCSLKIKMEDILTVWLPATGHDDIKPGTYDDNDPIGVLDVTISSNLILDEILGIKDLRSDKRIDFVGGIRGLEELKKRVDSGEMKVALALYPVSMKQLMDIADTGNIMPPKTTWFEPKLRSGLVIHKLS